MTHPAPRIVRDQLPVEFAPVPDGHVAESAPSQPPEQPGYEWVALSVTTVGALLAAYMILMGGGSGLFNSPNVNALMSSVPPRQRGTASGINTMVANTGQMLSIAIAFPPVLSRIPEDVMFKVFLYGGGMGDVPEALHAFEQGLHQAFLVSVGITLVAALASAFRPSHSPREVASQQAV